MKRLLVAITSISGLAQGAVTITNFQLTTTTLSFNISGTMPATPPAVSRRGLYFVNPVLNASPGVALGSFVGSATQSFTGTQSLRATLNPIQTGSSIAGDYFFVVFENDLAANEPISGTVSATWTSAAFDPEAAPYLNLKWGSSSFDTANTGIQLAVVYIPEPSSVLLGAVTSLILLARRRRTE